MIPKGGFGYIADGSEDEWTLHENTNSFNHVQIIPRVLTTVENPSIKTFLLSILLTMPIIAAPTVVQGLVLSHDK
ncbi:alpha-hydroxy-acid oxidizing protein [Streptococcus dysgalactiae]|uniref:alpha-hydroxy-acid oxidizing protein n=1 Tax=Streptococcus dysgalactiae TaxID=1334 RepID=UPI00159C9E5B|nr:alpha-hydroxy-acid oxidizing protein [Streptococcus dysgalactiae]MCB2833046.1 alpha-hydroxy-acid oxidizing protein [Streptococcus dysgalactiae subsp. dysgalactiae]MCB2840752.1 alpha-hydroxy-acid oxidizing protein [Streptococcus dysgalactiae subsp. dysgalactiae]MCB2844573.1 alpha-hydroxy-acid oxidizing protein [Streptococcus dysgalactiae subsp. dysgalactiae]QQT04703.1 alpha-hydroxy-acid oxidizing protein [Streptococcus dysgalactiae]